MEFRTRTSKGETTSRRSEAISFEGEQLDFDPNVLQDGESYDSSRTRAFQGGYAVDPRYSQVPMQQYQQTLRGTQREFRVDSSFRRLSNHQEHEIYARETRGRGPLDDLQIDPARRVPRMLQSQRAPSPVFFDMRSNGRMRQSPARILQNRRCNSPGFGSRIDESPLEPAMLDMYPDEINTMPSLTTQVPRRREFAQPQQPIRQQIYQPMPRRPHTSSRENEEMMMTGRRPFHNPDLRQGVEAVHDKFASTATISQTNYEIRGGETSEDVYQLSQQQSNQSIRPQMFKRPRLEDSPSFGALKPETEYMGNMNAKQSASAAYMSWDGKEDDMYSKRRCGRKSMNYSSEQKRERNRAAVKKCRQRQALKLEYLQRKAESLAAENQTLSQMLVKNAKLGEEQRTSLTRGIQIDILLKVKEIFTQSLPKDFVLDADSIWDLNSVLTVSMPSRCYYGIESIKDFWRTSLRMRNKGKIRSFWGWLFRLPPGDRFSEFDIQPFSSSSNLYIISWTTKSTPLLTGSMVIMFGNGHRVTLHVECFGWLIWRYLLTNEPFPEASTE